MKRIAIASLCAAAVALAGCGDTKEDRGITGAGLGAAGGAIIGALTGSALTGALIGTAAGGAAGLLTDKNSLNIGDPIWKRQQASAAAAPAGPSAAAGRSAARSDVQAVQSGLAKLGYDPGPTDGVAGPRTRDAIRHYQKDRGLVVDGTASFALAQHIDTELQSAQR